MHVVRTFRMSAAVVAAALVVGALGTGAAEAGRPTKPGGITGLQADVTPHPGDTYDVAAHWNAVATATRYQAQVTKGGSVISSATLTGTSWSPTLSTTPGVATLSVKAVFGHRKGKVSSVPLTLEDVTKPTGAFSAAVTDNLHGDATITQDAMDDDSGAAQVTRTVNWADGSGSEPWPTGTTISHHYSLTSAAAVRFGATVTLTDAAGNARVVDVVPAPVFNDTTKPTGSFTAAPASAWANLTKVTVTQRSLSDDKTPVRFITRSVAWGDGTTSSWTTGTTISHQYRTGGTKTPIVTVTDEAGNAAAIGSSAVVVKVDSKAPVVKLTVPLRKHSVKAWKTLHGKATDAGTGVKSVTVQVVEKRGAAWYGYDAKTHRWLRGATKAKASARSVAFHTTTTARHRWTAELARLRRGTLVVKVVAQDRVANHSATVTRKATLTTR